MPRRCTICDHSQKPEIDAALMGNAPLRGIARTFGVSEDALWRHKSDHFPAALAKAEQAKEAVQADSLLDQLLNLTQQTLAILKEAREGDTKDNELALKAIGRAEKQIELQARLLGELQDTATVNVLVLPQWQQIRAIVLEALAPFPQAKVAVAGALQRINEHRA